MSGGAPAAAPARTFRRSAGARLVSTVCAAAFLGAAISVGANAGATPGLFVLGGLALLGLAGALGAWADRYTLDETGIEYRNVLLARLGSRPRRVAWEDVAEVREHRALRFGRPEARPSALFLIQRSGRRMVLDSLADFEEAAGAVRRLRGARLSSPPACPPR